MGPLTMCTAEAFCLAISITSSTLSITTGRALRAANVYDRVQRFLDEVVNPSTDNILVVTHAVVILVMERAFEGLADEELLRRYEDIALPNGHIQLYFRLEPGAPWERYTVTQP